MVALGVLADRFLEMVEPAGMAVSAEPAVAEVMPSQVQMAMMQLTHRLQSLVVMAAMVGMARTADMVEMAEQAAWP